MFLLHDIYTMHDLKRCSVCPDEIAEGTPRISITDYDFSNDPLTGGGTAHRCNWVFLQRLERLVQNEDASAEDEHECINDTKNGSLALTERAIEMQTVVPYRANKIGEPAIRPTPSTFSSSTRSLRKRSVFHAGLNVGKGKSKAYFHT